MARRTEEPSETTLSDISGWTSKQIEQRLAAQGGLNRPSAGLPDENAIEEIFGFTRDQLCSDETRRRYIGKRGRKRPSA